MNKGDLSVWWIPQVPMEAFRQEVKTIIEGKLLLETLAMYDLFQLENNIKPDFSNAGGLQMFNGEEWEDIESEDGDSIDDYNLNEIRNGKFALRENQENHSQQIKKDEDDGSNVSSSGDTKQRHGKNNKEEQMHVDATHLSNPVDNQSADTKFVKQKDSEVEE